MIITVDVTGWGFNEDDQILETIEAITIEQVLQQCRWNQSKTARRLGISRGCLRAKLEQYWPGKYTTKRGE